MYPFGGLPENLASFCALLRRQYGFHIGAGELIDAARALQLVNLSDEQSVRSALRTVLAGTQDDVAVFDAAFERFFRFRPGTRAQDQVSSLQRERDGSPSRAQTESSNTSVKAESASQASRLRIRVQGYTMFSMNREPSDEPRRWRLPRPGAR